MSTKSELSATTLVGKLISIFKAMPTDKLEDIKDVADLWDGPNSEHEVPGGGELGIGGRAQSARGGNAAPMVREFSSFSAQSGLVEAYERLEGHMADMKKAMEGRFGKHEKAMSLLATAVSDLVKAKEAAEAVAKAPAEPAVPADETFLGKATLKIEKARKAFRKAELADEEDKEEREERKSHLASASDLLKAAVRLLKKAEDSEAEKEDEIEKAIAALRPLQTKVTKALADIVKAEDEEKKEEEEAKKAAEVAGAAAKAVAELAAAKAGTEDSSEEDEEKNDSAKKAAPAVDTQQLQDILNGLGTMKGTMETLIQAVMGQSRNGPNATPPTFIKGAAPAVDVAQAVNEAIDSGYLEGADGLNARVLLSRMHAVNAGNYSAEKFQGDLDQASTNVRQFFRAAA